MYAHTHTHTHTLWFTHKYIVYITVSSMINLFFHREVQILTENVTQIYTSTRALTLVTGNSFALCSKYLNPVGVQHASRSWLMMQFIQIWHINSFSLSSHHQTHDVKVDLGPRHTRCVHSHTHTHTDSLRNTYIMVLSIIIVGFFTRGTKFERKHYPNLHWLKSSNREQLRISIT